MFSKGQLISKRVFGVVNSSKKPEKNCPNSIWYDSSGQIVFVRFLKELRVPKSPFEINWPLPYKMSLKTQIALG